MVIRGNTEEVKLLVKVGVDLDMLSVRGMTPVKMAAGFGHFDFASYLLARGVKLTRDQDFLVSRSNRGYIEGPKLALDKVVSIDDQDSKGLTIQPSSRRRGTGISTLSVCCWTEAQRCHRQHGLCYTGSRRSWPPPSFRDASRSR